MIWLSPVYESPQDDNGYDISDYRGIFREFGTMEDMETLIREAKARGIKIVMDLVANHTSDEHPWFLESRSSRNSQYRDYYIWRSGSQDAPPNGLTSCFGGSAWEWDDETGSWYLHLFSRKQPDLNWENPKMRRDMYDMINWWLDKGIGGFRLDVIDTIGKEPDRLITGNGPKLHDYIREMSAATFQNHDVMTVGETWSATVDNAKLYSNPDGSELSMIFQFQHIQVGWSEEFGKWKQEKKDFVKIKQIFSTWQRELRGKGWNSLFWDNHDLPRAVSSFGEDGQYRTESAKALATFLHGLQGTPYIYQGEELGMTNIAFREASEVRDIESRNFYQEMGQAGWSHEERMAAINLTGRDNARTPMQWDDSPNAGFTTGTPWIRVNPNYSQINAAAELADENSVFHYYRRLIALRKSAEWGLVLVEGDYMPFLEEDPDVFAYIRAHQGKRLLVLGNFHPVVRTVSVPETVRKVLLSNYPEPQIQNRTVTLRPCEAFIAEV